MNTPLIALTFYILGIATPVLALVSAAFMELRRIADINDAPCLVCRNHNCDCGE